MQDRKLTTTVPDADIVLLMAPEELARHVLDDLNWRAGAKGGEPSRNHFHLPSYLGTLQEAGTPYRDDAMRRRVEVAVAEAWGWLASNGMLAPSTNTTTAGFHMVTRAGREVSTAEDFASLRLRHALPRDMLHTALAGNVLYNYVRGEFEAAVLLAFKEVEIAVREAARLPKESVGTDLMRKAFRPKNGPLTDSGAVKGERDNLGHLFAGAIGVYRNPASHRRVEMDDPAEAAELLMMASHLLRIVDSRKD